MKRRVVGAVAPALLLVTLSSGALAAQTPPPLPAEDTLPGPVSPYRLNVVSPHGHGTAVAVALRLHVGSQDDPPGGEGTAWLLGRVLERQVNRALDPARALATVVVERATTVVTVLALPDAWEASFGTADATIFDAALDPALVDEERLAMQEVLTFEAGSPFRDFEAEAATLLAEPGSLFARPPMGTRSSLAGVGPAALEGFRSAHVRRDAAVQAVVGPVPVPPGAGLGEGRAEPPPAPDVAWVTGDRVVHVRDVTNTWMQVAYPAPADLPRTHLELVAHLLTEELDPTPPPPDRYGLSVRIDEAPRGPILVVQASVFPEAAATWEARILGAVARLSGEAMGEDFFRWRRRRFRADRLLAESAPEVEARRLTADLLRDGRARDLGVEIWALDAATLREAARSLGPPRVFILGPDLGQSRP